MDHEPTTPLPPSLAVGHEGMDSDHTAVWLLARQIDRFLVAGRWAEVVSGLRDLEAALAAHFWREEALMAASAFPDGAAHVREHRDALARLRAIGAPGVTAEQTRRSGRALWRWFSHHITTSDRSLASWLRVRQTPDEPPFDGPVGHETSDAGRWPATAAWLADQLGQLAQVRREVARARSEIEALADVVGEALVIVEAEGRVLWCNGTSRQVLGSAVPTEVQRCIHRVLRAFSALSLAPARGARDGAPLPGERTRVADLELTNASGRRLRCDVVVTPVPTDSGRSHYVVALSDSTERYQRAATLREREARLRALVDGAPVGILRIAPDLTALDCNPAFCTIVGAPRQLVEGRPVLDWVAGGDDRETAARRLRSVFDQRRSGSFTLDVRTQAEERRHVAVTLGPEVDDTGATAFAIATIQDLTETRQLELELRRAQKLEAVGSLASGIAHEINTPVQFVGDNIRFLSEAFAALVPLAGADAAADLDYLREEVPAALRQTAEGVERIASIVRAMKQFGHPDPTVPVAVSLDDIVANTVTVARNETKYVADVELDLGGAEAVGFPGDIGQVVLNLLVNAAHAITDAERQRGCIRVRTSEDERWATLEVTDDGIGIPSELHDRIFEPFFTTKGTGQGLALAHHVVVERHQGRLEVRSAPGNGTTFRVHLPRSTGA